MSNKKIKVKVKVRKIKFLNIILCLLILYIIYFIISTIINKKISNIYITGNNIISDKEIISTTNLEDYPSFVLTSSSKIKKLLLKNDYIKEVEVTKKGFGKIIINIKEKKILFKEKDTNKLVLEDKTKVDNIYSIDEVPILINTVDSSEYDYFIKKISKVDSNILLKISEIEYAKVDVDKQRFLLYMNDGNYVYITLSKIENLNKYEEIYNSLEGKKGIIYLDSGNYFEEVN
ncbi:MAG: FtsQ-type POTRA domain-containing protein [Tenericutes bacterium]|nr:FtsQ-type POTRA domain-containing protein [Mycoplasmatota bacterium]